MRLQELASWLRPPALVRVESGPVVLPGGRTAAFVELTGWGFLSLEGRHVFFRGPARLPVVIRADEDVALELRNPFGRSRHVVRIPSTAPVAPSLPAAPPVELSRLNVRACLPARVDTARLSPDVALSRLSPPRGS